MIRILSGAAVLVVCLGAVLLGPYGVVALCVILAAVATDVLALLVGSRLGRTPFFHRISPKKTVEGALAGLIGAILVMVFGSLVTLELPLQHAVAIGILIGIGAEGGDLVESQMKRIAGVKDSSNLIPGHGGALDA